MFGFLNINKPKGISSHKVISVLRKITGIKQIGHAGTLDPMAQGVLPIAIGKASKLIDYLVEDKAYQVEIKLGITSDTYDLEGTISETGYRKIKFEEINEALKNFRGKTTQIPPAYSAVHYNGKRLYELARAGKIPRDIPSREIEIYKNEIISFDYDTQILKLDIECSKGTYIRTIVNDLGNVLGSGGVMCELIRTKSSGMHLNTSINLSEDISKEDLDNKLINPLDILNMNSIEITEEEYKKLQNGNHFKNTSNCEGNVLLIKNSKILALAQASKEIIQPRKLLV